MRMKLSHSMGSRSPEPTSPNLGLNSTKIGRGRVVSRRSIKVTRSWKRVFVSGT